MPDHRRVSLEDVFYVGLVMHVMSRVGETEQADQLARRAAPDVAVEGVGIGLLVQAMRTAGASGQVIDRLANRIAARATLENYS
ncbi:hypothetical protein AB0H42_14470 [Nocardia sp. NPDC050799]|uniref:hypothetical protein n=1 Tax=Nocardia sp. NPDC050799 TaxID=3154842 RepID=UPI003410E83A